MKKILLISHGFPPKISPEGTMAKNSLKGIKKNWQAEVICGTNNQKEKNQYQKGNIHIHRIFSPESLPRKILNRLQLSQGKSGWERKAVIEGSKIVNNEKIEFMVSRSNPISSHLVALKIKKENLSLKWLACFSDPWTESPFIKYPFKYLKKRDEKIELKIMQLTDKISVTTKYALKAFVKKYPFIKNKIYVLPNTCDKNNIPFSKKPILKNKIVMTYAGSFYGPRSPEPLFKAMKKLEKSLLSQIQIQIIGASKKSIFPIIKKYKLEKNIRFIPTLPQKECFKKLSASDILLLIDAPSISSSVFLPSKLVEYIFFNLPILAITPQGASSDLIRKTRTGIVASPENPKKIAKAINKIIKKKISPNKNEIYQYCAKNYFDKMVGVFK